MNKSYPKTPIVTKDQDNDPISAKTPEVLSPPSVYSGSEERGLSGPNPGDYPIISLIDEPSVNYYEQVYQTPDTSPSYIISSIYKDNYNPYYAPEEFTYNQDPILIDHGDTDQDDFKEITKAVYDEAQSVDYDSHFSISQESVRYQDSTEAKKTKRIKETKEAGITSTLSPIFLEQSQSKEEKENIPRSINYHNIIREPTDLTNLVNTIEYKPADIKPRNSKKDESKAIHTLTETLGSVVNCSASTEQGFCPMTSSYPRERIEALHEHCSDIMDAFQAVVPEDIDTLGDNSVSVISSEKDLARPWSWKVYAYKKKQVCPSELSFIQPSYALDTEGKAVYTLCPYNLPILQGTGI